MSKTLDASKGLVMPMALAAQSVRLGASLCARHSVGEKLSKARNNPVVVGLEKKKDMLLTILAFAVLFHGVQFKNLFLCVQLVLAFLLPRVQNCISTITDDVQKCREKIEADKGDEKPDASKKLSVKENSEETRKVLKSLDAEKLAVAFGEGLTSLAACALVLQGGLAQKIVIAERLVNYAFPIVQERLAFPGYEDLSNWTTMVIKTLLWVFVLFVTVVATPFALALNCASTGATLALKFGRVVLCNLGQLKDDASFTRDKELVVFGALVATGTIWQVWALASASGMAWYFHVLYMPAVVCEAIVSMFGSA